MKTTKATRRLSLVAAAVALAVGGAPAAFAGHIPSASLIGPVPFTVTPGAVGEGTYVPFTATYISFDYMADVDQTAGSPASFIEQGIANYSVFHSGALPSPIAAGVSGLNVAGPGVGPGYNLYMTFTTSGTASPAGGGVNVELDTWTAGIYVDVNSDSGAATRSGGSIVLPGITADDILVASSTSLYNGCASGTNPDGDCGGAHVFPGLAAGDFDVVANFTPVGGFFSVPLVLGLTFADHNGVNTTITGVAPPPSGFTNATLRGSGNTSVSVPEPATLALLGMGLAGMAFAGSRRNRRKTPEMV